MHQDPVDIREILDNSAYDELRKFLKLLSHPARTELISLMLLGRGDISRTFAEWMKHCEGYSDDEQVTYILSKTWRLDRYLTDGLAKLSWD